MLTNWYTTKTLVYYKNTTSKVQGLENVTNKEIDPTSVTEVLFITGWGTIFCYKLTSTHNP